MAKYVLIVVFMLLARSTVCGQITDFVRNDGIVSPLHRANLGKITFMGKAIPIGEYTEADFLASFELQEHTDLNIRIFLSNSLTNFMHPLAPDRSAEELARHGNFQFSFFVDGQPVYTENLVPGAGSAESKHARTVFRVPLMSTSDEDSWGRFLWNRFLMNGGEDALFGGSHVLDIEIRPYVAFDEVKTGDLIARGRIRLVLPRKEVREEQIAVQSIRPASGWVLSTAAFDSQSIRDLNQKIANHVFKDITSIVVVRDGKLLIEEYFNGAHRETRHDTRSVGKSFASTFTGIAIRDGFIKSEDQQLKEFYPLSDFSHYSSHKDSVTLRSLLTMTSAFSGSDLDASSPGNEENMYPTENWVRFALSLPVDSAKVNDRHWDYFTAGVVLLGDILNKSVPNGLEKYADATLFKPLGIATYEWQHTPQGVVNTAGGLNMRSLDYASYGQLYKNGGSWIGEQIVPKAWVERSMTKQIPIPGTEDEFYGYLFWNKTYAIGNTYYEAFYSSGNGGNKIFIFKDHPFVIVVTATAYNAPYGHAQVDRIMQNYLIPAISR